VDNAVHANLLAARRTEPLRGSVINVACGIRVSVNELAASMAKTFGRADLKPKHEPERAGDVKHSLADLIKAGEELEYEPIVDFDAGLRATCEWYSQAR